ncbi:MAG: PEP-CTERM sorting domain-containing protein [Myxococcota bacterium]|nr:PEP-CTERM sorting domain-containing protein [Myxococcota bacterium]
MKKWKLSIRYMASLAIASLGLPGLAAAAPIQGDVIAAGWDFSQFATSGSLTIGFDDLTFEETKTNTPSATASDFDPTDGVGAESAAFGTLYFNGDFGSTNVDVDSPTVFPLSAPSAPPNSLATDINAPQTFNTSNAPFDSFSILAGEGQEFTEALTLSSNAAAVLVFEADLSSVPEIGIEWFLNGAGRTYSDNTTIGVEFSTDGVSFDPAGDIVLGAGSETEIRLSLGTAPSDLAYARLTIPEPGSGVGQVSLDNITISAVIPEPATALLLGGGLLGLSALGRRRN